MIGPNNKVKGSILLFRVFDIAHEVNLKEAESLFKEGFTRGRFNFFRDPHRALIIREAPLVMELGQVVLKTPKGDLSSRVMAKVWDYGALSVSFEVTLPENLTWKDLVILGSFLDDAEELNIMAFNQRDLIIKHIQSALKSPTKDWNIFEDYTTYILDRVDEEVDEETEKTEKPDKLEKKKKQKPLSTDDILKKCAVAELINAEVEMTLSAQTKKSLVSNTFQYSKDDLLILDWNSALLVDLTPEKNFRDYADIIEFSLTHSLELRRYDFLLDQKLSELYDSLETKNKRGITNNYYARLLEDTNRSYIEYSEFFERINNSLKTVGDYYLAAVFRSASKKFRFEDWQQSTRSKMETLDAIAEKLQNEQSTRQSHVMEMVIIIMIGIEVIPLVFSWLMKIWEWLV